MWYTLTLGRRENVVEYRCGNPFLAFASGALFLVRRQPRVLQQLITAYVCPLLSSCAVVLRRRGTRKRKETKAAATARTDTRIRSQMLNWAISEKSKYKLIRKQEEILRYSSCSYAKLDLCQQVPNTRAPKWRTACSTVLLRLGTGGRELGSSRDGEEEGELGEAMKATKRP